MIQRKIISTIKMENLSVLNMFITPLQCIFVAMAKKTGRIIIAPFISYDHC